VIAAVIVAAGSGERLGAGRPKALVELSGRPLYEWSLEVLLGAPSVERVVVVLPAEAEVELPAASTRVDGGPSRSHSVRAGVRACERAQQILVHDAARPLISGALVETLIERLAADELADGAVAAAPVADTIKRADAAGAVTATLQREGLWAIQTPQLFRAAVLRAALEADDATLAGATDDASLIERAGGRIVIAPWLEPNFKVTTQADLVAAAGALADRAR